MFDKKNVSEKEMKKSIGLFTSLYIMPHYKDISKAL